MLAQHLIAYRQSGGKKRGREREREGELERESYRKKERKKRKEKERKREGQRAKRERGVRGGWTLSQTSKWVNMCVTMKKTY